MIVAILQARYSSSRLVGKVLKKIKKKTILELVYDNVKKTKEINKVIIATSWHKSDDKIYRFCKGKKITCFRGSLKNLAKRYHRCLQKYKSDAFVRICCDSPFMSEKIISKCIKKYNSKKYDLVTNVYPRSYPKGQSVEIIKSVFFEHIYKKINKRFCEDQFTEYFYQNSKKFNIYNVKNKINCSNISLAIDTKKDLINARKNYNTIIKKYL